MTHENNSESIFELQCSTTATASSFSCMVQDAISTRKVRQVVAAGDSFSLHRIFSKHSRLMLTDFQYLMWQHALIWPTIWDKGSGDDFTPTDHLLDPRVDCIIARRGVDFLGWGIHPGNDWIREQNNGGPYMTKIFMHKKDEQALNPNGTGFDNGKNYRMYPLCKYPPLES